MLADTGRTFLFVLGVGQSAWKGTPEWDRTTFLVDPKGVVRKVYTKIDPSGHEKLLLENLDALVRGSPPMEPRQRAGVAD
jgi:peroxiredoxin Q/BCP